MFIKPQKDKRTKLEIKMDEVIDEMNSYQPDSEEYSKLLGVLERLTKIKQGECKRISPDTKALIGGNLLGIVLILGYERYNVITSKALGFVLKGRV